jgi:hypothetical protein
MSVYSIALPRCPVFFKRRKYSKVAFKLSLPMIGYLSRTPVLTLKL